MTTSPRRDKLRDYSILSLVILLLPERASEVLRAVLSGLGILPAF